MSFPIDHQQERVFHSTQQVSPGTQPKSTSQLLAQAGPSQALCPESPHRPQLAVYPGVIKDNSF